MGERNIFPKMLILAFMTFQQNSDSFNTFFDILVMTELALLSFHFAHLPTPRILLEQPFYKTEAGTKLKTKAKLKPHLFRDAFLS